MARAVAKEYPIGHDGGTAATHGKHTGEESDKEEFGLLGIGDGQEGLADGLLVDAASERRIGKAEGVTPGVGVVGGKAVLVLYVGVVHAMQHQVHCPDAEHGLVGVEAVEHTVFVVVGILFLQELLLVVLGDILGTFDNEAGTAHCGVADGVFECGLHQLDHHTDDVARGAELTVVASSGHLAEDVLVDIAHGVAVVHVEFVDTFHNLDKCAGVGD